LGCNIFEGLVEVEQLAVGSPRHILDYADHIDTQVAFVSSMHPEGSRNHGKI
jgi:hypothetical protein